MLQILFSNFVIRHLIWLVVFANLHNFYTIQFLYLTVMSLAVTFVLVSIVMTKQFSKTTTPVLIREQANLKRPQNIRLHCSCLMEQPGLGMGLGPAASW